MSTTTAKIPTLNDLPSMDEARLREAESAISARLADLHVDDRGNMRDLSGDDQDEFDRLIRLHGRVKAHLAIHEGMARGGLVTTYPRDDGDGERRRRDGDEVRSQALRILERRGRHLDPAAGDRVDALIRSRLDDENPNFDGAHLAQRIVLTENDAYQRAFTQVLAAGMRGRGPVLSAEEAEAIRAFERFEARAMAEGAGSTGGVGLPVFIDPTVILTGQQAGDYDEILSVARVVPVTTNVWKGVSSAGVSWQFQTEASEVTDNSPTLDQPTIPVHTARGFIPYSIEIGQDYPMFAEEMRTLLSEGYLDLAGNKVTVGSGNDEPTGIVTALTDSTASGVTIDVTTSGQIGAVDVYGLWSALPKRARRRASWMSEVSVMNAVRRLGSAESGTADASFTIDFTQEAVTRLFGRRYLDNSEMAEMTTGTTTDTFLVVGDFSRFVVAQRIGMNVEPVPHLFGENGLPTGQRGFFAWARIGSDSVDDDAFRALVNTTN